MDRQTYENLTNATQKFLDTLHTDERLCVVANFYRNGTVRVGHVIERRAEMTRISSCSRTSPVGNVVARLSY